MVFLFYSWIADFVPMTLTVHLFEVVEPFFCQNRQSCMSPLSSIRHPEEASTVRRACLSLLDRGILEGRYTVDQNYPRAKVASWRLCGRKKANLKSG